MSLSTHYFRLGLIGYPVSHSLSPKIQNTALQACGLEGEYSLYPIHPEDMEGLKEMLARVRSGKITGLNVTIPHKQNVIPLLDELTPTAKAIGAVNVIYMREERMTGDNTDAHGFLSDLRKFLTTETQRHGDLNALVLGAGGSARSVVYALLNEGWNVTIAARRIEQAQKIAQSFQNHELLRSIPMGLVTGYEPSTFQRSNFQLVVNTTPIGMAPNVNQSPLPENTALSKDTLIYDLVYNPRETKLVKDARAQGLQATTGLGMLIEQAALGFQLWTGHIPARDVLWNAVES